MSAKTIAKLMSKDLEFAAKFMIAPKSTMEEFGINPESLNEREISALEAVVEQSQDNLRTNAKLIGVELAEAAWGIGASCCNSKLTAFDAFSDAGVRRLK